MQFIKTYWEHNGLHAAISTRTYCKTVEYLMRLVEIAKQDYPDLQDKGIAIVVYGGNRIKGFMGIEFSVPEVSDDYVEGTPELCLAN